MQTNFYHPVLDEVTDTGEIVQCPTDGCTTHVVLAGLNFNQEQAVAVAAELNQAEKVGWVAACKAMRVFLDKRK